MGIANSLHACACNHKPTRSSPMFTDMPLHKSNRASRLDPTMISAPLGDFRHTMHVGRGGDAFGDTSFLLTLGPNQASPPAVTPADDHDVAINHGELQADGPGSPENHELQHSESVSSFTLDLELDLGPSMLGDVLGVMDGMGLEEDVFSGSSYAGTKAGNGSMETSLHAQNDWNGKNVDGLDGKRVEESRIPDGNEVNKPKGLRPKVRFSDKREEIIRQASEEEEGQSFEFQDEEEPSGYSPTRCESEGESALGSRDVQPQSPASSLSSECDGVTSLDRRRADSCHSETDSEEEEEAGRGYTFEDEFDDEIGL